MRNPTPYFLEIVMANLFSLKFITRKVKYFQKNFPSTYKSLNSFTKRSVKKPLSLTISFVTPKLLNLKYCKLVVNELIKATSRF